jgi:hypothetical protein
MRRDLLEVLTAEIESSHHPEFNWNPDFAYAVGLIATDGFISERNTIGFSSTDPELVDLLERSIGQRVHRHVLRPEQLKPGAGLGITARKAVYMARIYDSALRDVLIGIGITRRKSLTLGSLAVPSSLFFDLVGGLIDGDGSIMVLNAAPHGKANDYRLTRLRLAMSSGSESHVLWLRQEFADRDIRASIQLARREAGRLYHLVFSDRQAATVLTLVYQDPRAPRLWRKRQLWERYLTATPRARYYGWL